MNFKINKNSIKFILPKKTVSKTVLKKALYWYSSHFFIEIQDENKDFTVLLKSHNSKSSLSKEDWENIAIRFNQDLLNCDLQNDINNETKTIRELLIAKAFYYSNDED